MRGTPALYFKSLNRPFTVLGVDRCIVLFVCGIVFSHCVFARLSPVMDVVAGVVFLICMAIGVFVTRVDSQILAIYRRHIHYHYYYAAQPTLHAKYLW